MDLLALIVAVVAIIAAIFSATTSSVRNEAHHQVTLVQELLKEISQASHEFFLEASMNTPESQVLKESQAKKALAYELLCSVKCDLLESSLLLLVRRCSRILFFDADVETFKSDAVGLLGTLRDDLSIGAYSIGNTMVAMHKIDADLVRLHILLNEYIGERFRPIFERR